MGLTLFVLLFALVSTALAAWLVHFHRKLGEKQRLIIASADAMGAGLYVMDRQGQVTFINQTALDMLGFTTDEVTGQVAHYLFHSHAMNENMALEECPIFRTVSTTNEVYQGQELFSRKDGSVLVAAVTSKPLARQGRVSGSITVFYDTTESVQTAEALRRSEMHLRQAQGIARLGSWYLDIPSDQLRWADETYHIFGIPVGTPMTYKRLLEAVHPDDRKALDEAWSQAVQQRQEYNIKHRIVFPDGSVRWVRERAELEFDDNNELKGGVGVVQDITDLHELRQKQELQQALLIQQAKLAELGYMIGAIAHQWRQPLNSIALMAQTLPIQASGKELCQVSQIIADHARKVNQQIQFMDDTLEHFQDFYRPSRERETFDIHQATRSVLRLLEDQLARHHIHLKLEGAEQPLLVNGYPSEFKQVVLNIITNAKDAFEERGVEQRHMTIQSATLGSRLIITISDNAGGIPQRLLPDGIFQPFTTTKGPKGTGIGLSLSRTIIKEKMQGELKAENVESGARFTITLPLSTG